MSKHVATTSAAPLMTRASRASLTTLSGLAVALITAALVAGVPAWHAGLPMFVTYLIPVLVGAAGTFLTALFAKHPVQLAEVEELVAKYGPLLGKLAPSEPASASANAPGRPVVHVQPTDPAVLAKVMAQPRVARDEMASRRAVSVTTTDSPRPESGQEETPALPPPEGHEAEQWAEKAEKALEARTLGRRLRKGKRVLFSSRHHLPSRTPSVTDSRGNSYGPPSEVPHLQPSPAPSGTETTPGMGGGAEDHAQPDLNEGNVVPPAVAEPDPGDTGTEAPAEVTVTPPDAPAQP